LKGAVANFGAKAVVEKAEALEAMGRPETSRLPPMAVERLQALLNGFEPELRKRTETGNGTGCDVKILIAEDDAISRRLLDTILRKWGYDVVVASGWRKGLGGAAERGRAAPGHSRLDMPEWTASRFAAKYATATDSPYVYILLLSAKSQREDLVKGMESGGRRLHHQGRSTPTS